MDEAFAQVEVGAGATTPPPGSWPPVAGTDATLFICYDSDCGLDRLCRKDSSLGDAAEGVFLSQFDAGRSRPAVAGNGALAVFVDTFNDLCLIVVAGGATEECLGYQGSVFSAAVSRDGETLAFILLDAAGEPDSRINVADGAGNVTSYQLSLPA